jgi:hypothetical protein
MGPRQIHHVSMTMDGFLLSEGNLKTRIFVSHHLTTFCCYQPGP